MTDFSSILKHFCFFFLKKIAIMQNLTGKMFREDLRIQGYTVYPGCVALWGDWMLKNIKESHLKCKNLMCYNVYVKLLNLICLERNSYTISTMLTMDL